MLSRLPLVAECVKFRFKGVLKMWERFIKDERSQQQVNLTEQHKLNYLLMPTNDVVPGSLRKWSNVRNATMEFINCKTQWGPNKPKAWVKKTRAENPYIFNYAWVTAWTSNDSGQSKRKRVEIAEEAKAIATTYTWKHIKAKAWRDKKQKELDACVSIEDSPAFIDPTRLKSLWNSNLNLQIN